MSVCEEECNRAGLDKAKVAALARRLSRAAKDADAMGLTIFGGSGSGSLRWRDPYSNDRFSGPLVVAHIRGWNFDGGDGAEREDEYGLLRGEGL